MSKNVICPYCSHEVVLNFNNCIDTTTTNELFECGCGTVLNNNGDDVTENYYAKDNSMKFYVFDGEYEYFAMIYASNARNAIKGYIDEVDGGDMNDYMESYSDTEPTEICKERALARWKKADIDGCVTDDEKEKEFIKEIDSFMKCENAREEYLLLLIDGSLL